jgi:hypothetical protein
MASKTEYQKRLFQFMSEQYATQAPFALAKMRIASGFSAGSFEDYRSKQFGTLLVQTSDGKFRVSHAFRRFNTWQKFRDEVVSQKRRLIRHYRPVGNKRVMSFEFFMPLRNEEWLIDALDSLFFKEQLLLRLHAIKRSELEAVIPRRSDETEDSYLNRLCNWISGTFGGYSISHVNGRFKAGELKTRKEVADSVAMGIGRYLVDETTAIVRFLFPCGQISDPEEESTQLAEQIRWFFKKLFVETILEVVNGEDEVWLVESGFRSQLQVFRAEG